MNLFGFELSAKRVAKALAPVVDWRAGWRIISEPFTGAWQRNESEAQGTLICYPTLYACLSRIATDIGKLPFQLVQKQTNGIWSVVENPAYSPVLRKPNHYQTESQFREQWVLSKLSQGNTYVLKERDARNIVIRLYILDPAKVQPMVSESGEVFYQVMPDTPSLVPPRGYGREDGTLVIPAREIIHDRCMTIHHPLIGVPPLCAAYWPALKNLKILKDATTFFTNGAQPGGILTAPAGLSDTDAAALKDYWDKNFSGENRGKVGVIGADMKFTSFAFKAADSQLVEQMRYSDEQICQPFGIPPFKIGIGSIPPGMKADDVNQLYYSDALQGHIEHMEHLLDDGLQVSMPLGIELDLEPLLRMDPSKQADVQVKLVGGKIKTPDEGRAKFNLAPTAGGDTLWGQHQDYPLGVLATRDDLNPAPVPAPAPAPELPEPDQTDKALALLWMKSPERLCHDRR